MGKTSELDHQKSLTTFGRAVPPFIGRKQQLDLFAHCLEETLTGRPQLVLLKGEAGVGKTRLLKEVRSVARDRGIQVCVSRFHEDFACSYLPFIESLLSHLELVSDDVPYAPGSDGEIISEFVYRSGGDRPTSVAPLSISADQDMRRLFLAVARATLKLVQNHPTLLVLEDLHWADQPSLELFCSLVFAVADTAVRGPVPLVIVGVYRPVEPQERLARTIYRFQREHMCQTVELAGLNEAEIDEFLQGSGVIHPSHQLVTTVKTVTQGNPLFIQEMLQQLVKQDALQERGGYTMTTLSSDLRLPDHVIGAIATRIQELSQSCQRVLTLAALLGDRFWFQTLRAVSGVNEDELLELLEEGMRQRLLLNKGQAFQFSHWLIRHVFSHESSAVRRQRIHQHIAQTLEHLYADNLDAHIQEIAHHLINAGPDTEVGKVMEYARRAGDRAFAVYAWGEAAHYYEAALSVGELSSSCPVQNRAELHYLAGYARYRDMDAGPSLDHYEKAITAYRLSGDVRGLALALKDHVGLHLTLASVPYGSLIDLQPLEAVLSALGEAEPGLRGRLWAKMAQAYWYARKGQKAEEMARRALEIGHGIEDDPLCAEACVALALGQDQTLCLEEALENWRASHVFAQRSNDVWQQGWSLQQMPVTLIALGRLDEAEATALKACELIRETYDWGGYSTALAALTCVAVARGDFAVAEKYGHDTMTMVHRSHYPWGGVTALSALACARSLRGAWTEAEAAIKMLAEPGHVFPETGPAFQAGVRMYRQLVRGYAEAVDEIREQLGTNPPKVERNECTDIDSLARFCAWVEMGDLTAAPSLAEPVYQTLLGAVERGVVFSRGWVFLLPRVLGVAATLNRWWDKAEAHFQTALETATTIGAQPELGRSYFDYARMLAARNGESDRQRALELVEQASCLFTALGMEPFARRATQLTETLQTPIFLPRKHAAYLDTLNGKTQTTVQSGRTIPHATPMGQPQGEPGITGNVFCREGEYWTLAYQGAVCRLKDAKGLHYIASVLCDPGREFHAVELATAMSRQPAPLTAATYNGLSTHQLAEHNLRVGELGDAGALLDGQAKAAYKHGLDNLREELEEAQRFNDLARVAKVQAELDFLIHEVAAAVGLGGRDRKAASATERARLSVTKAVKAALRKITQTHPGLGHHLTTSIKTGTFCSYTPDPTHPLSWAL